MKLTTQQDKTNRLKELDQELIQAREYVREQSKFYVNNDWNDASTSPIKRVKIEIAAWENDADEVVHIHHGVKINNRYIIGMNHQWSDNFKKWYPYRDINQLLAGLLA